MKQEPVKNKQKEALETLLEVILPKYPSPERTYHVKKRPLRGIRFLGQPERENKKLAADILKCLTELNGLKKDGHLYKDYRVLRKLQILLSNAQKLNDPVLQNSAMATIGPLVSTLRSYEEVLYPKSVMDLNDLKKILHAKDVIEAIVQGKSIILQKFKCDDKTFEILAESFSRCGLKFQKDKGIFSITSPRAPTKRDVEQLTFSYPDRATQDVRDRLKKFPDTYESVRRSHEMHDKLPFQKPVYPEDKDWVEVKLAAEDKTLYLGKELADFLENRVPAIDKTLLEDLRKHGPNLSRIVGFTRDMETLKKKFIEPWKKKPQNASMIKAVSDAIKDFEKEPRSGQKIEDPFKHPKPKYKH